MPSQKLTKSFVDRIGSHNANTFYWDITPTGFGLKVSASGNKSFVLQYRLSGGRRGRTRRITIGKYGSPWTVETARREATRLLSVLATGTDPALPHEEQRRMPTLGQLCDRYLEHGTGTKKPSTLATDAGRIERHIKPLLGKRKLNEITRNDIVRFQNDIASGATATDERTGPRGRAVVKGGKGTASRTIGLLGAIFTYAIAEGFIESNPAHGVKKYKDNRRNRFLSQSELSRLGAALNELENEGANPHGIAIIRLLAFTGARKGEIEKLKWNEFDRFSNYLRLEDSKTGQKLIPLSSPALQIILDHESAFGRTSNFIFCSSNPLKNYNGVPKVWDKARKRSDLHNVRLHDLRHSFASIGLSQGAGLSVLGALLGHRDAYTTQRYAHLSEDPVRLAAEGIGSTIADAMKPPR